MIKILFVCMGNICRSPMAEFVMKEKVKKAGLADEFEIASAAIEDYNIGDPVYPPAKAKLAEHGISCSGKKSQLLVKEDYAKYDYIITNPPIRAGKEVVNKILLEAKEHLSVSGELWCIIHKDQGAKSTKKLLETCYNVEVVGKSKGFFCFKAKIY